MKRCNFTLIAASIALALVAQPDIARADNGQVAAGVAGGLAFLTRGAALPLLVTAPCVFLWRKQYRHAAWFAAAMAPAAPSLTLVRWR